MKKNWPKLRLKEKATERLVKMPKRHLTQFENILILPKAIVPLITHSRFTSPLIQRNLAQFISKHRESVVFLVFFVKQYTVKLIFLIDEAVAVGKGTNPTISYVHYFLQRHGLGETDVHLHADNCGGQKKNNFFLWFFVWRLITKLHKSVLYSFLLTGRTKFGLDRCFGILKKEFRITVLLRNRRLASSVSSAFV